MEEKYTKLSDIICWNIINILQEEKMDVDEGLTIMTVVAAKYLKTTSLATGIDANFITDVFSNALKDLIEDIEYWKQTDINVN